ncbi:DUF5753 domain-containing protein [Streptomyces xiaopingdaonensis]|uniref:DUF5753 domain-containing protein n=1 Tax=Streptomyces xiaopingdaonensis TaxID=1565415 RepID=UPI001ED8F39B|nr:DUF5753 domain-containing protein [Streptomyces xiaopingdaonensis]
MEKPGRVSTVLGRRLGSELLRLRLAAELTQGQAAAAITASTAKVAKMETGWVPMRDPDLRELCAAYGVADPTIIADLLEMARVDRERRKARGWWDDVPGLATHVTEYASLEDASRSVRSWQLTYIPGLLQTERYARALREGAGGDESVVTARLERQRKLRDATFVLRAAVYEAALRQRVGGRGVMAEQLQQLQAMSQRPQVSLSILPFEVGAVEGLESAFSILSFAAPGAMDVVYMDGRLGGRWLENDAAATESAELFERIVARSLNAEEAAVFIARLLEENER